MFHFLISKYVFHKISSIIMVYFLDCEIINENMEPLCNLRWCSLRQNLSIVLPKLLENGHLKFNTNKMNMNDWCMIEIIKTRILWQLKKENNVVKPIVCVTVHITDMNYLLSEKKRTRIHFEHYFRMHDHMLCGFACKPYIPLL